MLKKKSSWAKWWHTIAQVYETTEKLLAKQARGEELNDVERLQLRRAELTVSRYDRSGHKRRTLGTPMPEYIREQMKQQSSI